MSQPDAVRAGAPRESQEIVFDAHDRAFAFFDVHRAGSTTSSSGGRRDLRIGRDASAALPADAVQPVPRRGGRLHAYLRSSRRRSEQVARCGSGYSHLGTGQSLRRHELLADGPLRRVVTAPPSPRLATGQSEEMFETERPRPRAYVGPFDGFRAVPASVSRPASSGFDNNRLLGTASAVDVPVEIRAYRQPDRGAQDGRPVRRHPPRVPGAGTNGLRPFGTMCLLLARKRARCATAHPCGTRYCRRRSRGASQAAGGARR